MFFFHRLSIAVIISISFLFGFSRIVLNILLHCYNHQRHHSGYFFFRLLLLARFFLIQRTLCTQQTEHSIWNTDVY